MVANKIGYPDKWRDYSSLEGGAAATLWGTPCAPQSLKTTASWIRSASP